MSANDPETMTRYYMEQIERDRALLAEIDRIVRTPVYGLADQRRKEKAEVDGSKILNRIWSLRRKIEALQGIPRSRSQVPDPEPTVSMPVARRTLTNPKVTIARRPPQAQD
jgi:hypothetical protein